jgi:transposase InsO family protein
MRGCGLFIFLPSEAFPDIFTEDYNHNHPHDSLADMTPTEFLNHRSKKIPIFAVGF